MQCLGVTPGCPAGHPKFSWPRISPLFHLPRSLPLSFLFLSFSLFSSSFFVLSSPYSFICYLGNYSFCKCSLTSFLFVCNSFGGLCNKCCLKVECILCTRVSKHQNWSTGIGSSIKIWTWWLELIITMAFSEHPMAVSSQVSNLQKWVKWRGRIW